MSGWDPKKDLHKYLRVAREALLWKPDGLSEVDIRRPMTATTRHRILVHVIAETNRHAGHADIVRELIDGTAGFRPGNDNLAVGDDAWWASYVSRLQRIAQEAG